MAFFRVFHLAIVSVFLLAGLISPLTGNAAVITTTVFEKFCKFSLMDQRQVFDPAEVRKGDAIYVRPKLLPYFFEQLLPHISGPVVLVTGKSVATIDENYLPFLENEKIAHWFGINITIKHPKATLIPLGVSWYADRQVLRSLEKSFATLSLSQFFENKEILMYVNWSPSHVSRRALLLYFSSLEGCTVEKRIPMQKYVETLSCSQFVISPRGLNIDCFRTWESLYAGSIPVVQSYGIDDIYKDLPVIVVTDLATVTKETLDNELQRLKKNAFDLNKLNSEYWLSQIRNCQEIVRLQ